MFKREDWMFGSISLAVGVAILLYCRTLATATNAMDPSGPAAMPRLVAVMMIVIGAIHIVGALMAPKKERKKEKGSYAPVVMICVACLVYYFAVEMVGYLVATPFLIAAIMLSVGERAIPRVIGTSVGTTIVLFCIFNYVLHVRMPLGFLSGILG